VKPYCHLLALVSVQHSFLSLFHYPDVEGAAALYLIQANFQNFAVLCLFLSKSPAQVNFNQLDPPFAVAFLQLREHGLH